MADIVRHLTPENQSLLDRRDQMQAQIDDWHLKRRGFEIDPDEYKTFLRSIGYLEETGPDFTISTANVDEEIATISGPQLVVPVLNARFAF